MTADPGEIEWQCPYCDASEPTLRDIQEHITDSTEGGHEGVSGDSPDEDIVGVDPDSGEEIDRHAHTDVVRPQDAPLEGVSKRKQAVYAWLANGSEEDADAIAAVTDAERDYVVQILGQIRRDEIGREYWEEDTDRQLLATMTDRLAEYDPEETDTMESGEDEGEQEPREDSDVTDKDIIINTYDLLGDDTNRKQAWKALTDAGIFNSGYEYFRREYKTCIDGETSDIATAINDQIQAAIEPVLHHHGLLQGQHDDVDASDDTPDRGVEATSGTPEGGVRVDDVQAVREKVEILHEESDALLDVDDSVGARRAEFIGEKTLDLLDELLD
jgi:hypothetical protein